MKPKISIIVPIYNTEQYLPQCMDSLLNQTLTDIEIILVDDGSIDNCPVMCDEYAKQDHRIRVVHKENGGLGYARNSGLEIATGEYVAFVDSDDYIELNAYQKLYTLASDTKADIVYFACQRFDDHGDMWLVANNHKEIQYHTAASIRGLMFDMIANPPEAKMDRDILMSVWSGLYRNEIIKEYGLKFKSERELISEDLAFNLDYLLYSSNVIATPDAYYNYRVVVSSLSRMLRADRITKNYYFYQYLLEWLERNNLGTESYMRATRLFIGYSRSSIRQYMQSSLSKKEKMQWLKEVINNDYWKVIASEYPYKKLPLKYALHFYLLQKGYVRLLYHYSKLGNTKK